MSIAALVPFHVDVPGADVTVWDGGALPPPTCWTR